MGIYTCPIPFSMIRRSLFQGNLIVKFIDLQAQYQQYKNDINAAIQTVLDHGQYINGPEVSAFEDRLADYVGVKHCIGNASGTTALQVALMALDIAPGDEVITTPFSFFATAEVIVLLGARPVYVDIDPKTYNIDPAQIEAAITHKTKAIVPVSLYGQVADLDIINSIAERKGLFVIEDAAQSLGATYKGRQSGSLTTIACTSFFPSKPLGCYGDGGACFTNDDVLAQKIRTIINHGQTSRYQHTLIGINGRLDTIQAAILLQKLNHFHNEINLRQQVAEHYARYLPSSISSPFIESHNKSAYAQYTIQVERRDEIQNALQEKGIPTAVHYPKGLHQQPAVLRENATYPIAEAVSERVLSLPFYPTLSITDIQRTGEVLTEVMELVTAHQ